MSSTFETGHARTLSNFKTLLSFIRLYGNRYTPSKTALQLPNLELTLQRALLAMEDLVRKRVVYDNAVNRRQIAFASIKKLATRLMNGAKIIDLDIRVINDLQGFNRKIQGQRLTPIPTTSNAVNAITPTYRSASQQSYVQLTQHWAGFVALLENEPKFQPIESEFQITRLTAMRDEMNAAHDALIDAFTDITNARNLRDEVLYKQQDNIVDLALQVKKYAKFAYGIDSEEYENIKSLDFRKASRK